MGIRCGRASTRSMRSPTQMARMDIAKQRKDISDIQKLLLEGTADNASGEPFRPAMEEMKRAMDLSQGDSIAETYMRKMVEHHKGAVAMSDVALRNGVSGALREQVRKTRDENAKATKMTEAMLGGATMQHAMEQSGVEPALEGLSEPVRPEKDKVMPSSKSNPASKATPKPRAGSSPAPTSSAAEPHADMKM